MQHKVRRIAEWGFGIVNGKHITFEVIHLLSKIYITLSRLYFFEVLQDYMRSNANTDASSFRYSFGIFFYYIKAVASDF